MASDSSRCRDDDPRLTELGISRRLALKSNKHKWVEAPPKSINIVETVWGKIENNLVKNLIFF